MTVRGPELKDGQLTPVRAITDAEKSRAALKVARAAISSGHTRAQTEEFLMMLGLIPSPPSPGYTSPSTGKTVRPATHQSHNRRKETS